MLVDGVFTFRTIVLPALSVLLQFLMPFIADVLPVTKQIVHVRSLDDKIDHNTQYPVLDFVGLVERHQGYTAKEYNVTTSDGYILRLHRITGGPSKPKAPGKPVVFLQHGIGLSSDSWVLIGPGKDLAFLLADAGKDVWLGNARGNTYSRSHVSKSPSNADFWEFSYHEMGREDLKSFIDFALSETGAQNLTYVGYSMGTTMSYVLLSERPEYNEKISMVHSAGPVVFWKHELKRLMKIVDRLMNYIREIYTYFDIHETLALNAAGAYLGDKFCGDSAITQPICVLLISNIGLDPKRLNATALPDILAHYPAGTSVINVYHYNDNYKLDAFQAYNYNPTENERRYGSMTPPVYNLSKVTAPVTLWFGSADDIVNEKDVYELARRLPNVKNISRVDHKDFNHFDFLWARDVKKLLYDRLGLY